MFKRQESSCLFILWKSRNANNKMKSFNQTEIVFSICIRIWIHHNTAIMFIKLMWNVLTKWIFHFLKETAGSSLATMVSDMFKLPVVRWITKKCDWVSLSLRVLMISLFLTILIYHPNECSTWWIAVFPPVLGLAELPNDFTLMAIHLLANIENQLNGPGNTMNWSF